jgi:hypothetical protein
MIYSCFKIINKKFIALIKSIYKVGTENWGADSAVHSLKKDANWLSFVQLIPNKDYIYERDISKLKQKLLIDEFLKKHNEFLEMNNDEVCFR